MPKNVFAGVGISKNDDAFVAGKEAVEDAIEKMKEKGGKEPTFGLVFCSGGKYGKDEKTLQKLVDGAHSVFGNIPWVGCTTCGEISNYGSTTNCCVACVVSSEHLQVGIGVGDDVHKNPQKAGELAVKDAITNLRREKIVTPYLKYLAEKRKTSTELMKMYYYFILLFSPGHTFDGSGLEDEVLDGVYELIGKQTPIIGGTAADDAKLIGNYEFTNGKVYKDAAVAMAVSTGVKVGFAYGHGYTQTDDTGVVTKSEGRKVIEINKKPAAEAYADMIKIDLGELWNKKTKIMTSLTPFAKAAVKYFSAKMDPKMIPFASTAFTNAFGIVDLYGNIAIRIPVRVVDDNKLLFAEIVPKNMVLNKLKIDPKKVIEAENDTIIEAKNDADAEPKVIFIFDCSLRKIFALGEEKIDEIIKSIKRKYPKAEIIGFGSMGEYTFNRKSGPLANSATVSVGVISDELLLPFKV
jgi:hypothetical protein